MQKKVSLTTGLSPPPSPSSLCLQGSGVKTLVDSVPEGYRPNGPEVCIRKTGARCSLRIRIGSRIITFPAENPFSFPEFFPVSLPVPIEFFRLVHYVWFTATNPFRRYLCAINMISQDPFHSLFFLPFLLLQSFYFAPRVFYWEHFNWWKHPDGEF